MSVINDRIEARLKAVGRDPRYRAVVAGLEAANGLPVMRSDVLVNQSLQLSVQAFGAGDWRNRERAYLAGAVAASERPLTLVDLPVGADKAQHFFLSGYLSAWLGGRLSFLPGRVEEFVAVALVMAIGWGKEVFDQIFGTGYSREDLQADLKGAWSPFRQVEGYGV